MTVYCPAVNSAGFWSVDTGSSDTANLIDSLAKESLFYNVSPRTESLASGIEQILAESENRGITTDEWTPVDKNTATAALAFSFLLPRWLPTPEIAPEADGEISFDWLGPSGRIFSVSIDAKGRLAYAGSFGQESKVHGIEQLSNVCPTEIIAGISKTLS
jgi:hypothetical protein